MHVIAAKAVAFHEALQPDFLRYSKEVIDNARVLGDTLSAGGLRLVTGGRDCHLLLADARPFNVAGNVAVEALERCGLDRQSVVSGKSVFGRVALGGRRINQKKRKVQRPKQKTM